jgi:hypothetical protein
MCRVNQWSQLVPAHPISDLSPVSFNHAARARTSGRGHQISKESSIPDTQRRQGAGETCKRTDLHEEKNKVVIVLKIRRAQERALNNGMPVIPAVRKPRQEGCKF